MSFCCWTCIVLMLLWRFLNAALVCHMKNDPVLGSLKLTFLSDCFIQRLVQSESDFATAFYMKEN